MIKELWERKHTMIAHTVCAIMTASINNMRPIYADIRENVFAYTYCYMFYELGKVRKFHSDYPHTHGVQLPIALLNYTHFHILNAKDNNRRLYD